MNRDELLTKLAMELGEWPIDMPPPNLPGVWSCHGEWRCQARGDAKQIFGHDWRQRRAELINDPDDADAPEWARWKAQDADGDWFWFQFEPERGSDQWGFDCGLDSHCFANDGDCPSGHDWTQTLREVKPEPNREMCSDGYPCDDTPCSECPNQPDNFEAEFDAKMLDQRLREAMHANANSILSAAAQHMQDRASTYDKPAGERSMAATVDAFRATTGITLTEEQGWHFMALLKLVRSQQGDLRLDSYEDGAAYFALAGEAAAKHR